MSDDYLTLEECKEWRDHYDDRLESTLQTIADNEKSIKKSGWTIVGILISILGLYFTLMLTSALHAEDKQATLDQQQDERIIQIYDAIAAQTASNARSTAIMEGHIGQAAEARENFEGDLKDIKDQSRSGDKAILESLREHRQRNGHN